MHAHFACASLSSVLIALHFVNMVLILFGGLEGFIYKCYIVTFLASYCFYFDFEFFFYFFLLHHVLFASIL